MPVIVASPAYPRPPIDGDKVRWSALLAELACLDQLHGVLGFMRSLGERREPAFDRLFATLEVIPTSRAEVTARAGLLALRGRPSAFGRRATPRWREAVQSAAKQRPDVPVLLLGTSGGCIAPLHHRTVLDLIDVRSRVRTLDGDRLTSAGILAAELRLAQDHHVVLACETDRRWLVDHGADAGRIHVVPHGVDRRFGEVGPGAADGSNTILFVGSLRYPPNRHAIDWFRAGAWPALQSEATRLRIVGYGAERLPPSRNTDVFANVPDILPHYQAATIAIAPLLEARGTQFKVLESMAAGLPVVCTTPVAAGLFADHPAVVADDPSAFVAACASLLHDPPRRRALAADGRAYIKRHHDWSSSAAILRETLRQPAASGPNVSPGCG